MKNKTKAKKGNKAKANEKLAKGAAAIKKAKAAAEKNKPLDIKESTRSINDILADRVTVLPGSVGVILDKKTPLEESLRLLDYFGTFSDHVGFMIGDVLNFGNHAYGEKYQRALNQTGRAYSTLAGYAEAARRIPAKERIAALSYTHHRELLRLGDAGKITSMLKTLGADAKKGKVMPVSELRDKVKKLAPRKKAKKSKNGADKPEEPAYTPTAEEQAAIDSGEEALKAIDIEPLKVLAKCDDATKDKWAKLLTPWANLCDALLK